jgi:hypothetical protein
LAQKPELSKEVKRYAKVDAPKVVLAHVRLIDGTGAAAVEDQNVVMEGGKISVIENGADVAASAGVTVLELRGYSVTPGFVGMHNHLYYAALPNADSHNGFDPPVLLPQMTFSAPRLYLAGGVTTMRTTGSVETYADLNLKHAIDEGKLPGPHIDVTGPYLEGPHSYFIQMHELTSPDEASRMVDYWADRGVSSFKAYMNITRAELKAAIEAAHKRGIKVTGHLCSVTYKEAAELGIDDLEHGFFVNTQLDPGKKPDECSSSMGDYTLEHMDPNSAEAKDLIATLANHHVAITSTLPVFEGDVPGRPPLRQAILDANVAASPRSVLLCAQQGDKLSRESRRRGSPETRYGFGASLCRCGRTSAGWSGPHRRRRSRSRIWRSARDRIAGGGRILSSGSNQSGDAEWRDLPGQRQTDWIDCRGQECRSSGDEG